MKRYVVYAVCCALAQVAAGAQMSEPPAGAANPTNSTGEIFIDSNVPASRDRGKPQDALKDAKRRVRAATRVVQQMQQDAALTTTLRHAHGLFVIPDYAQTTAGTVGGGGAGVITLRRGEEWTNPAFYRLAGLHLRSNTAAHAGSVVMLLMSDKAVNRIRSAAGNFALDASAGLTMAAYSGEALAAAGREDLILWSDGKVLSAGAPAGATLAFIDDDANSAYYGGDITPAQILSGDVYNPNTTPLRNSLRRMMASR